MKVLPLCAVESVGPAITELARLFGLGDVKAVGSFVGCKNVHHRLATSSGDYVLRTSHPDKTSETLRFEVDLLAHLSGGGYPTPERVPSVEGEPFIEFEGGFHSVTRYLAGSRLDVSDVAQLRAVGGVLATFHALVRDFHSTHAAPERVTHTQRLRVALGVVSQADTLIAAEHELLSIYDDLVHVCALGTRAIEVADALYDAGAVTCIHGGCRRESALFTDGALVGMLDFDSARPDLPLVDLAIAVNDVARVHGAADLWSRVPLDLGVVAGFMAGYQAVTPLAAEELEGIYSLMVVRRLLRATGKIAKIPAGRPYEREDSEKFKLEWCRARWLEAHREQLFDALGARR